MIPGFTSRTFLSARLYFAVYSGTSGRGPTRLISPRSTLNSCGSSSILLRRRSLPILVIRRSPEAVIFSPCLSAPRTMLRNLMTWKGLPFWPTRHCRKKIGPRDSSRTASAQRRRKGAAITNTAAAPAESNILLPKRT